ncbi:hypothetical protein A2U01_0019452 [Trifolium medium]|uniref:Aspartic peptidase DDI1-type domain-containing protein n=1 Tax=Trifolium medium TaxID=97028 RepID=A0A392NF77_9FABA|nr:hypothetical protein [Trifolium medium]
MEITLEDARRAFLNEMEELHEKELRSKLPPKLPDPGKFTIPCSINRVNIEEALLDLGSSINLMPLALVKKYNMGRITLSNKMELLMAVKSIVNAQGMIEDVLVKVNDLAFPVDFVVIDIDLADEKDIILGRPFVATSHACINMKLGELKVEMNEEVRTLKVYKNSSYQCYKAEVRDKDIEDARRELNQEWIEMINIEINSRGSIAEHIENEEEKLWHTKAFALGKSINCLKSSAELTRKKDTVHWLLNKIDKAIDIKWEKLTIRTEEHRQWIRKWKQHQRLTKSKFGVNNTNMKRTRREQLKVCSNIGTLLKMVRNEPIL